MKKITLKRRKESFNQGITYKIFIGNNILTELKKSITTYKLNAHCGAFPKFVYF